MKPSPVQLLQSTIEKLCVSVDEAFVAPDKGTSYASSLELQVKEEFHAHESYWNEDNPPLAPGIEKRTFVVRLGIRTNPEQQTRGPYVFELEFAGIVACMPERLNEFGPDQAARQYGFAMLYGAMREQFLSVTSRMTHGPSLLPTVSFMEDTPKSSQPTQAISGPEGTEGTEGPETRH